MNQTVLVIDDEEASRALYWRQLTKHRLDVLYGGDVHRGSQSPGVDARNRGDPSLSQCYGRPVHRYGREELFCLAAVVEQLQTQRSDKRLEEQQ